MESTNMKTIAAPRIKIDAGAQFGYHHGPPWCRARKLVVEAVQDVSANAGLHLVVAPNGSGKTTLLRTLAGLHPALQGQPAMTGRVIYVSDDLRMDEELPARTLFRAWFLGAGLEDAFTLADRLRLDVRTPIGLLSRGNRQKVLLVIAETLAAESESTLMLMDEPLSGVDADTREIIAAHWSATDASPVLRLVVLHEVEVVRHADSLITIIDGKLRQTRDNSGRSWAETYRRMRSAES